MRIPFSIPASIDNPSCLAEVQALHVQLQQQLMHRNQHTHALELKNQKLTDELASVNRLWFGCKAESLSIEHRNLFEKDFYQDLAIFSALLAPEVPETSQLKQCPRADQQLLSDHLERVEVRHEPYQCTCGHCHKAMIKLNDDVSEKPVFSLPDSS